MYEQSVNKREFLVETEDSKRALLIGNDLASLEF